MIDSNIFLNVFKGKRVLVTGHTGFKGAWLTQWLLNLGAEVAGYSLYIPSNPSLFEILNLKNQLKADFRQDILDLPSLKNSIQEFEPEFVFHLAAQPIVSQSFINPKETFMTNSIGMLNILEVLRNIESVKSVVLITSDKCYENLEWEYGYKETDRLGGKDPYSASKACAEIIFSSYMRSFLSANNCYYATTRAGNVIGGGDWAKDRIVPDCMVSWSSQKEVSIRNPNSTRPWQHVLEPLSGYLWLAANLYLKKEKLNGEAFNFGPISEQHYSVSTLLEHLKEGWSFHNVKLNENSLIHSNKEAGLLKLSCDKALARLAWSPTLTFKETADFTTKWYQVFYSKSEDIIDSTNKQIREYCEISKQRNKIWI